MNTKITTFLLIQRIKLENLLISYIKLPFEKNKKWYMILRMYKDLIVTTQIVRKKPNTENCAVQ